MRGQVKTAAVSSPLRGHQVGIFSGCAPSIVPGMKMKGDPAPGVLGLVRRGPFARLWWAGLASSFGDWVALFATIALADAIGGVTGILVPVSYTHLRAHETVLDLVCRLLLEKKK